MSNTEVTNTEHSADNYAAICYLLGVLFSGLAVYAFVVESIGALVCFLIAAVLMHIFAANAHNSSWHPLRDQETVLIDD